MQHEPQDPQVEELVRITCAKVVERLRQHGDWDEGIDLEEACVTPEMALQCFNLVDPRRHFFSKDEDEVSFGSEVLLDLALERLGPICESRVIEGYNPEYRLADAATEGNVPGYPAGPGGGTGQ